MSKSRASGAEPAAELFPIRTVSRLTGVNSITLRAWEQRYGLIEPIRKASGHRLYTQEHIDLINRVVGLLDRGMRIGQVKAALAVDQAAQQQAPARESIWQRYLNHMIASVIKFDESGLEQTYGEALSLYPVEEVTRNLLEPLLVELGRRWEKGRGSIAEEHFFGFYLRNKLGARFHHRQRKNQGPLLLMACLPGDRHEIGLLLFALAANDHDYRPVLLGADTPLEELPVAARKTGCAAIILAGFMLPPQDILKKGLSKLVKQTEVPVMMGGHASVLAFDAIRKLGIEPLGTDIEAALKRIGEVLDRAGQEPN